MKVECPCPSACWQCSCSCNLECSLFFLLKGILLTQLQLVSMRSPVSPSANLLSKQSTCSLYWFLVFFIPGAGLYICLCLINSGFSWPISQHVEVPAHSSPVLQHIGHSSNAVLSGLGACEVFLSIHIIFCKTNCVALMLNEGDYNTAYCMTVSCMSK